MSIIERALALLNRTSERPPRLPKDTAELFTEFTEYSQPINVLVNTMPITTQRPMFEACVLNASTPCSAQSWSILETW